MNTFKRLFSYVWVQWQKLLLISACTLVVNGLTLTFPLLFRDLLNKALIEKMPALYRDPIHGDGKEPYTHYGALVGPTAIFRPEGTKQNDPKSLPLDKAGEKLVPGVGGGPLEGRAGFFDLSIDGRWGGVISGDHIEVDYRPCACGAKSPSISDNIYRYSDLKGDDKIACSGTIDAYVRGIS